MDSASSRFSSPLSSLQTGGNYSHLATMRPAGQAAPAAAVITPQAILAKADSTQIDATAESVSEMQALIERLSSAKSPEDVVGTLQDIQRFLSDGGKASLLGDSVEGLMKLANTVLTAAKNDPASLGKQFQFSFSGSFSYSAQSAENFYSNRTALNFSFSFSNETTAVSGSYSFDESLNVNQNGLQYSLEETMMVTMVSVGTLEKNPVMDAFHGLLRGMKSAAADLLADAFSEEKQSIMQFSNSYRSLSVVESMRLQFTQLSLSIDMHEQLTLMLGKMQEAA